MVDLNVLQRDKSMSDHSMLVLEIHTTEIPELKYDTYVHDDNGEHADLFDVDQEANKSFIFKNIPENFMNNDLWKKVVEYLLNNSITKIVDQTSLDEAYEEMLKRIFRKCDLYLDYHASGKSIRKRCRPYKPYWDKDLTASWKILSDSYKIFKKARKAHTNLDGCRQKYKDTQKDFDKILNSKKRTCNRNILEKIERLNTSNHKDFWNHLNSLGPRKNRQILNAVKWSSCYRPRICDK